HFLYSNFEFFVLLILGFFVIKLINQKFLFFTPLGIIFILQFGNLNEALEFLHPSFGEGMTKIYIIITIFCIWSLVALLLWAKSFQELRNINLILTSVILLGNIFEISAKAGNVGDGTITSIESTISHQVDTEISAQDLPNIIYIVPDRYSGIHQLQEHWGFDNSEFYQDLSSRGFVTNEDSRSNYPFTHVSLPSTLNSSYLSTDVVGSGYELIKNASAFRNLKELGYYFINLGNREAITQNMKLADLNFRVDNSIFSVTSFSFLNYQTPIINILNRAFPSAGLLSSCSSIKDTFESLKKMSLSKENGLFIYAHMLVPHDPYLLNSKGECNERKYYRGAEGTEEEKHDFTEYLMYANLKLLEIFDEINKNNNNFIFVIQSDEGQYPLNVFAHDHESFTKEDWDVKTGIINAFYYSNDHELRPSDFLTPINNFAHIFDLLGNNNIQKKPHKIYIPDTDKEYYDFKEIYFQKN
ncbi:hypothetical protein N9E85_03495, partial [Gammaproteobacteria bacterium]|nr:hypothetical protein [Gammaproteobacteria bacterium]